MQKWEYRVSDFPLTDDPSDDQAFIAGSCAKGWELVAARNHGDMVRYYFKRPLPEEK